MWERLAADPERDYTNLGRFMFLLTPVAGAGAVINFFQSDIWFAVTFVSLALALFQSAQFCETIRLLQER
jgi:hypothetical protein